jgi:hypothetical protein
MDQFAPLLFILIVWLCIGLPISKISQNQKNKNPRKTTRAPAKHPPQETSEPRPVPETPSLREEPLRPTVSVTPRESAPYLGSLGVMTGEGEDPCHEEDLAGLNSAASSPVIAPTADVHSLPFGWTGSDMVRGIVISEILNRKK